MSIYIHAAAGYETEEVGKTRVTGYLCGRPMTLRIKTSSKYEKINCPQCRKMLLSPKAAQRFVELATRPLLLGNTTYAFFEKRFSISVTDRGEKWVAILWDKGMFFGPIKAEAPTEKEAIGELQNKIQYRIDFFKMAHGLTEAKLEKL